MPRYSVLLWLVGVVACAEATPEVDPHDGGVVIAPDAGPIVDASLGSDAAVEDVGFGDASLPSDAGRPAELVLPEVVAIPYVVAGQGASELEVEIENLGDADAPIELSLGPSSPFAIIGAPVTIPAHSRATFTIRYAGSPVEAIAQTTLHARFEGTERQVPVFGVAGDPAIGGSTWDEVRVAQTWRAGSGTTIALPTAPFPIAGAPYTDDRVRVFLPEGYRDLGAQSVVLHFHGFSTTLASTLAAHRYQEQVYASGANVVLVVPQGPVSAQSGNFGKLMEPSGTAALLREILVLLYREGRITHPILGEVILSAHSGGYQAVALNLDPLLPVRQIDLYDSIYGYLSTFEAFVTNGGRLRSNYTSGGGTLDNNQSVAANLTSAGVTVASAPSQRALKDAQAMITFADSTHDGSTRLGGAYGEWLRFGAAHGRSGPRIELRTVVDDGAATTVTWLSPADDRVTGFVVERSTDGLVWDPAIVTGPGVEVATLPTAAGSRVRVRAQVLGVDSIPSDVYRVDPGAEILVVDHFDRTLGGGFGGLSHDFAAIVGESAGPVTTIAHRAIEEDGFELDAYPVVIWLLGDQSADDRTFTSAEQAAIDAYLGQGGRLIVSGSEVGYDLSAQGHGAAFLSATLGASYLADDSLSEIVGGAGPLASLASFGFGGPTSPYPVGYPDVLGAPAGSTVILRYGDGRAAAVGIPGKTAILGFPLETIDRPADRVALLAALLSFVGR